MLLHHLSYTKSKPTIIPHMKDLRIQRTYTISADETVGPLRIQISATLCMNKIYSQGEYYICHFKCCNANLGDFHTTCFINILRTDLRTKMILARPQSVGKITKTTTQLEFKKHYSNKAPHYQGYF